MARAGARWSLSSSNNTQSGRSTVSFSLDPHAWENPHLDTVCRHFVMTTTSAADMARNVFASGSEAMQDLGTGAGQAAGRAADGIRHEVESEAHQIFRSQPGHKNRSQKEQHAVPGIEHPGSAGTPAEVWWGRMSVSLVLMFGLVSWPFSPMP